MSGARTAALLAGGRSVRMGRDKSVLVYQGEPLWRHQAATLRRAGVTRWLLACRSEQELAGPAAAWSEENGIELRVVPDPPEQGGGALGALVRCLRLAPAGLLALTVDMPLLDAAMLEPLWPAAEGGAGRFWEGPHGIEPFPGFYPASLLPVLEDALTQPRPPALKSLLRDAVSAGFVEILPASAEQVLRLANWNRPEDVAGL